MLLTGAAVSACGSPGSASPTPSAVRSSAGPSSTPAATASSTPSLPQVTLAGCGPPRDAHALQVVHTFAVSPDDIAVGDAGRLWVTAREANQLIGISASGGTDRAVTTQTVSGGPEGVASDGSTLLVAQQDRNAIAVVTPAPSSASHTLVSFPNPTSNAGIDGIAIDAAGHRLLVPDSPTGQLFAVSLAAPAPATTGPALPATAASAPSSPPQLLGSGLGRPVAAATDPAGNVYVASESTPGLSVISPSGAKRPLGHFTDLDEVVYHAGLLYVTELDHRDVLAVDPSSGASAAVSVNLPSPQGLAVTASGTLEIVDSITNTLYSMPACGVPG